MITLKTRSPSGGPFSIPKGGEPDDQKARKIYRGIPD